MISNFLNCDLQLDVVRGGAFIVQQIAGRRIGKLI